MIYSLHSVWIDSSRDYARRPSLSTLPTGGRYKRVVAESRKNALGTQIGPQARIAS